MFIMFYILLNIKKDIFSNFYNFQGLKKEIYVFNLFIIYLFLLFIIYYYLLLFIIIYYLFFFIYYYLLFFELL